MYKITETLRAAAKAIGATELEELSKRAKKAEESFQEALEAFETDRGNKVQKLEVSISSDVERLQKIEREKAELVKKIGEAYSMQKDAEVHAHEKQLEELARAEFGIQSRIKYIRQATISGDRTLFDNLRAAYTAWIKAADDDFNELAEVMQAAKETQDGIFEITRRIDQKRQFSTSGMSYSGINEQMVKATESMIGPLDVSGNTAGTDESAKVRVIRQGQKVDAGVFGTPASRRWFEFLKEGTK